MKQFHILPILLLLLPAIASSQASSDKYIRVLQAVIDDARNDFRHIQIKSTAPGIFETNQALPSQSAVIKISNDRKYAEWISSSKAFEEKQKADDEYRQLYKSMSNAIIKISGEQPYILNGTESGCEKTEQLQCSFFQLLPQKGFVTKTVIILSIVRSNGKYRVELVVRNKATS
jgi:hypothetical protein